MQRTAVQYVTYNMEAEQKVDSDFTKTEEKPLISLFASFQDYLSNDQEIREVRFISPRCWYVLVIKFTRYQKFCK